MQKLMIAAVILGLAGIGPALPQEAGVPTRASTETGSRLVLLGTAGGPIANARRSQPAQLLVVDGRPYLIDAGEGTVRQLRQAGFSADGIGQVFLTHLHLDHTLGIAPLLGFNWVSGHRRPVAIIGPPGTAAFVGRAIDYLSIPSAIHSLVFPPHPKISDLVSVKEIKGKSKQLVFEDDRLRVFAVANAHYIATPASHNSYGENISYSYRFETKDRTFVVTGDTGPSSALVDLAHGADVLVTEIIDLAAVTAVLRGQNAVPEVQLGPLLAHMRDEHLSPLEVGKLAAQAKVKMVVLSHVAPTTNDELPSLAFTQGVREHYEGPVVMGRDLFEF